MKTARGFTLIEILVALVILSISASIVAVKMAPDTRQTLVGESARLATLLDKARDEALLTGCDMALTLSGTTYTFEKRTRKGWESLQGDDLFHPRTFDTAVSGADLKLDNKDVRLVMDHAGWATPGVITLHAGNLTSVVRMDPLGGTTLESL